MKSIISKILVAGAIVAGTTLTLQATPTHPMMSDTGKMSKMSKMKKADKMSKMDKMDKMGSKKMKKDSGKMSKM
jgi:hypothetical protein